MFSILYQFLNDSLDGIHEMDDMDLRYDLLKATVVFRTNDALMHMPLLDVPTLDLAFVLCEIAQAFERGIRHEHFEFTETDEMLLFDREEEKLTISLSFHEEKLETTIQAFSAGVREFHQKISAYIREGITGPIYNKALIKLLYPE